MPFYLFYDCYALDEAIPSDNPVPTTVAKVKTLLPEKLHDEGDFVGILDEEGTILQFMKQHAGIWMEVPDPEDGGSYGKHVTLDEARDVLDELGEVIERCLIDGLAFEPWEDPTP